MNQKREASFVFLAGKVSFFKDSNSRDGIFFFRGGAWILTDMGSHAK